MKIPMITCRRYPSIFINTMRCSSVAATRQGPRLFHQQATNRIDKRASYAWRSVNRAKFGIHNHQHIINSHLPSPHHHHFSTAQPNKSQYTHPLSQIVLEHLQSNHSAWIEQSGLNTGLTVNQDGTFVLRFPNPNGETAGMDVTAPNVHGSIWTMYEADEKKHYLCVKKGSLVGRYMLQDNTKPAWHSDKRSTPERVQDAVDQMIERLQVEG